MQELSWVIIIVSSIFLVLTFSVFIILALLVLNIKNSFIRILPKVTGELNHITKDVMIGFKGKQDNAFFYVDNSKREILNKLDELKNRLR